MRGVRFTKIQALGNDFLILDGIGDHDIAAMREFSGLARAMCDRRCGVGADGLIALLPPEGPPADVRMRLFNADGSEAEISGNGARCAAKAASDRGYIAPDSRGDCLIQTGAGVRAIELVANAHGLVESAVIDMGAPVFEVGGRRVVDAPIRDVLKSSGDLSWMKPARAAERVTCVSVGNPHIVIFCADVERVPLEAAGAPIERDKAFPQRINVQFAQVEGADRMILRTWERGAGATPACGSGACAALAAAAETGRASRAATVSLVGGEATVRWDEGSERIFLASPVEEVFSGEWPVRRFAAAGG